MNNTNSQENMLNARSQLRFSEKAQEAFQFLIDDYKFSVEEVNLTFVKYGKKNVFVDIYHGRMSYEMGVEIGMRGVDEPFADNIGFNIGYIAELYIPDRKFRGYYCASKPEQIDSGFIYLVDLVKKYAKSALNGDISTFTELWKAATQRQKAYEDKIRLQRVRNKVEIAWSKKDYIEIIRLLESIEENLTKVEVKKLSYARKKIANQ